MPHREVVRRLAGILAAEGLEHEQVEPGRFVVVLPGRTKLRTTVSLAIGPQALTVNAFVCRRPDENAEQVYRWLLQQNTRLFGVGFALDQLGDIYLVGRIPVGGLTEDDLDRLLGQILAMQVTSIKRSQGLACRTLVPGHLRFGSVAQFPEQLLRRRRLRGNGSCGRNGFGCCWFA